jgi:hypothetical protein
MKDFLTKMYEFFRYDLKYFFRNIWTFRKELLEYRNFDYCYNLILFKRSLEDLAHTLEFYGIDEDRLPKIKKMKKVIRRLDYFINDSQFDEAKKTYPNVDTSIEFIEDDEGITWKHKNKKNITEYYDLCHKLKEENWKNIWIEISEQMQGWWDWCR